MVYSRLNQTAVIFPPFLLHFSGKLFKKIDQFCGVYGFDQIVGGMVPECLLCVGKFLIAGEDHSADMRHMFTDISAQGNSVHDGHIDIRKNNIDFRIC